MALQVDPKKLSNVSKKKSMENYKNSVYKGSSDINKEEIIELSEPEENNFIENESKEQIYQTYFRDYSSRGCGHAGYNQYVNA